MRESLLRHLRHAMRPRGWPRLLRTAWRGALVRTGVGRPSGPLLATVAVTYRCPLRCAMCDLPSRRGRELDDTRLIALVDAVGRLRPSGIGFTGGEPLLRGCLERAVRVAARSGAVVHLNTSGFGLDGPRARALAEAGLDSVSVSVDDAEPRGHDALRGRLGSHEQALSAIERFSEARRRGGRLRTIWACCAIDRIDPPGLERLRDLVRRHGADGLTVLPVHPFTGFGDPHRPAPARPAGDLAGLGLENSRAYLRGVAAFLAGGETPSRCSAPRSALFLDPYGRLYPCTPAATRGRPAPIADPETLAGLFRSGRSAQALPPALCRRCWWNCHRELDLALGFRLAPRISRARPPERATRAGAAGVH